MLLPALLATLTLATLSAAYSITVVNNCAQQIWPAATQHNFASSAAIPQLQTADTGYQLAPGSSHVMNIPAGWVGGRIWARTGCDASGNCQVGTCPGGMHCTDYNWAANAGISLAEFGDGGADGTFYDISLEQGFNFGVEIKPGLASCATRTCTEANCPAAYHNPSQTCLDTSCSSSTDFIVTFCPTGSDSPLPSACGG